MATRKIDVLNDVLIQLNLLFKEASVECNEIYEKVQKNETDLREFSRAIGVQIGINRVYHLVCDLYDKAIEENK